MRLDKDLLVLLLTLAAFVAALIAGSEMAGLFGILIFAAVHNFYLR